MIAQVQRPLPQAAPVTPAGVRPAAASPVGGSYGYQQRGYGMDGWINTGSSLAHLYNGVKTAIDGGKLADPPVTTAWRQLIRLRPLSGSMKSAVMEIGNVAVSMGKRSALFAGAISAAVNGYRLVTGRIGLPQFGGAVVGDTLGGFAGGVGASVVGGIGFALLGGVGLSGIALTIGGALCGMVGYVMAENMLRGTRLYGTVVGWTQRALGGMSRPFGR